MPSQIDCLKKACNNLKIPFQILDKEGLFISIRINNKSQYFISNKTPLDKNITTNIVTDKFRSYQLLNSLIKMPKSMIFMDPQVKDSYKKHLNEMTVEKICQSIEENFSYPIIIKKNSGYQGINVLNVQSREAAIKALTIIYNHQSEFYDHLALVQEKIEIKKEYRVTVIDKQIELIYLKDKKDAKFIGNISPLHWQNSKAILIKDNTLKEKIQNFIDPIFKKLDLNYAGLDIVLDEKDQLYLLEINASPTYEYFVKNNGEKELIKIYEKILKFLMKSQKNMLK